MLFAKMFGVSKPSSHDIVQKKRTIIYRNLMRQEAQIGGLLFGPIKKGGRREFFCLDERTWVWHEEWTDNNGQKHILNTRYDMRPSGVLKAQNGQGYQKVTIEEAKNLKIAIAAYMQKVQKEIYQTA